MPDRAGRAHGGGGHRGGARVDARAWSSCRPAKASSLEIVRDEPWLAFCDYLGDLRSRIAVNVDLPMSAIELLVLAIHETYPGHHAERCEQGAPARARPRPARGDAGARAHAAVARLRGDRRARAVRCCSRATAGRRSRRSCTTPASSSISLTRSPSSGPLEPCRWAEVNAALMLHDAGASEAEAQAYLERWGLMTPEARGAPDPLPRPSRPRGRYMITYAAGRELCRAYVGGRPGALPPPAHRAGARPRPARGTRRTLGSPLNLWRRPAGYAVAARGDFRTGSR